MKRPLLIILALLLIAGIYVAWNLVGPVVKAREEYFYIHTGDRYEKVKADLLEKKIIPKGSKAGRL